MLKDIELIHNVNPVYIEHYLYKTFTGVGFSIKKALELSSFYPMLIRTSSFTKTGTYGVSIYANTDTGVVTIKANGHELRNNKDIVIEINELGYYRVWWFMFLKRAFVKRL